MMNFATTTAGMNGAANLGDDMPVSGKTGSSAEKEERTMERRAPMGRRGFGVVVALAFAALAIAQVALPPGAEAFRLKVADESGAPVSGFRYLVQRDNTR